MATGVATTYCWPKVDTPVLKVGTAVTISVTSVSRVYRERFPVNRTCSIISSLLYHAAAVTRKHAHDSYQGTNVVRSMEEDSNPIDEGSKLDSTHGGGNR